MGPAGFVLQLLWWQFQVLPDVVSSALTWPASSLGPRSRRQDQVFPEPVGVRF